MRNQYSAMQRELEQRTVVLEEFHLGWCKIQPYRGEKLGGWVSENFYGICQNSTLGVFMSSHLGR